VLVARRTTVALLDCGYTHAVQTRHGDSLLIPVYEHLRSALDAFVLGDARPYKDLWAHTDDVFILGAFGGRSVGWGEVGTRLDFAATQYRTGRYDDVEVLAAVPGTDMAYILWLETISATSAGGDAVVRRRRVTHVLRREDEAWLIVHSHDRRVSAQAG
jgi:ketosteroid isomerase-like protein